MSQPLINEYLKQLDLIVVRAKSNLQFRRVYSRPVDKETGLRCDQTVRLTTPKSSQGYPDPLRRVKFYDGEHDKRLGSEASLYTILQILSLTLVEKTPLDQLLANSTLKMENLKHLTNWIYSLK